MKISKGYRIKKQDEVLKELGINLRYKGSYEIESMPDNLWLWFPHCESKYKGDFKNEVTRDNSCIIVTPTTEKGRQIIKESMEKLRGRSFVCMPKQNDGYYTFIGVYKYSSEKSNESKEVYEKISDSFTDEL